MIPVEVDCKLSFKEALTEWIRYNIAKKVVSSKVHSQMFEKSTLILTTTNESKSMIPEKYHNKIIIQQAIGIDKKTYEKKEKIVKEKFVVLMSGRMLYWKGFDLGIKAFGRFSKKYQDAELHIFGDGEKRRELERFVKKEGLSSVHFHGNVSHDEMLSYYKNGTLFLNCSFHDSGSFVVLESMANGIPIVSINTGGPSVLIDDSCAIRINPDKESNMISDIEKALESLYTDKERCEEMGKNAQKRAFEVFCYDKKYEMLVAKIKMLLGEKKNEL